MTGSLGVDLFIIFLFIVLIFCLAYITYDNVDPYARNRRRKMRKARRRIKDRTMRWGMRQKHIRKCKDLSRKFRR